jgi:hypothetical protein
MDTSRLGRGHIIASAGGAVLVLALFLHWEDITGQSAWDAFSGMDIIMLIVAVAALIYGLGPGVGFELPVPNANAILFVLGVLVAGWALGWDLEISTAGLGAWLGLFAALAIAVGARDPASVSAPAAPQGPGAPSPPPPAGPGGPPPPPPAPTG